MCNQIARILILQILLLLTPDLQGQGYVIKNNKCFRTDKLEYINDKDQKILHQAAENGDPAIQNLLGFYYLRGNSGISMDLKIATKWFAMAAAKGDVNAMNNLGFCYYFELGVKKNITVALKWWKKAAGLGHPESMNALSMKTPGIKDSERFRLTVKIQDIKNKAGLRNPGYETDNNQPLDFPWNKVSLALFNYNNEWYLE